MPFHDFRCPEGHVTDRFVEHGIDFIECEVCHDFAKKVFLKAPQGFVSQDICYDSPVTGKPITTMKARIEDLKRNNCVPYDPEQKKDYHRRIEEGNAQLEKKMEQTVEAEIEKLPPRKRELLATELRHNDVDVKRITPNQTSSL
jgi:hypothetical protein